MVFDEIIVWYYEGWWKSPEKRAKSLITRIINFNPEICLLCISFFVKCTRIPLLQLPQKQNYPFFNNYTWLCLLKPVTLFCEVIVGTCTVWNLMYHLAGYVLWRTLSWKCFQQVPPYWMWNILNADAWKWGCVINDMGCSSGNIGCHETRSKAGWNYEPSRVQVPIGEKCSSLCQSAIQFAGLFIRFSPRTIFLRQ